MSGWTAGNTGSTIFAVASCLVAAAIAYWSFYKNRKDKKWELAMNLEETYFKEHRSNLNKLHKYVAKRAQRAEDSNARFPRYYLEYRQHRQRVRAARMHLHIESDNTQKEQQEDNERVDSALEEWL